MKNLRGQKFIMIEYLLRFGGSQATSIGLLWAGASPSSPERNGVNHPDGKGIEMPNVDRSPMQVCR